MASRLAIPLIVLGGACLGAACAEARVFQRTGAGGILAIERMGRCAYAATLQVNGTPAFVAVTAVDGTVRDLAERLAAAATPGAASRYVTGEGMGVGRVTAGDRTTSVLALTPGREDRTLAVTVEQSVADQRSARDAALAVGATGIPALPGSTLTCTMRNDDTRTALEVRRATVAPSAAAAYYDATLRRDGWMRLMPQSPEGNGLLVYMKDADVCCVQVRMTDPRGECQVTLVRKPGATQ